MLKKCRDEFPDKTIWLYTGYSFDEIKDIEGIELIDVLCDGEFMEDLKDNKLNGLEVQIRTL